MQRRFRTTVLLFSLIFVSAGLSTRLEAQYTDIQTNPLSLVNGTVKLMTDFAIPSKGVQGSIEPQFSLLFPTQRVWTNEFQSEGTRFGVLFKLYFQNSGSHKGFYGFAYMRAAKVTYLPVEGSVFEYLGEFTNNRRNLGLGLGYKWVTENNFVFGMAAGVGRASMNNFSVQFDAETWRSLDSVDQRFGENDIDAYARITFGYRFLHKSQ